MNTLEQVVRGYLCGSNDSKWKDQLFNDSYKANKTNVQTYFYRFEFQKRGTIHLHLLVWLKRFETTQFKRIRGDIPVINPELRYYVDNHQLSNKNDLPLFDNVSTVVTDHAPESLRICHPFDAFSQGLRGYIDTLLPA